jgi:hypothetical protein
MRYIGTGTRRPESALLLHKSEKPTIIVPDHNTREMDGVVSRI